MKLVNIYWTYNSAKKIRVKNESKNVQKEPRIIQKEVSLYGNIYFFLSEIVLTREMESMPIDRLRLPGILRLSAASLIVSTTPAVTGWY